MRGLLGKYCLESSSGSVVHSLGNIMVVKFRTDFNQGGRGFHLRYTTICNTDVTGLAGVIESPNFPEEYPHNR